MAELTSGAVTSLLGVIRNEWRLLGRVGGDVQFIREEMESMNSFLMHLARTAPPGSEHDEQVRTWMNQVRLLAQDCNNCIDLYLYRGNPDIHLGRDRLRRYLRWVPWFLQKIWAQHRAALELGELKERARDVGQRRLRYGVEVPKKAAVSGPGSAAEEGSSEPAAFIQFDDEDDGHDQVGATATDGSDRIRRALFGVYILEDYFNEKLTKWIEELNLEREDKTKCAAFLVPGTEDSGAIAREALAVAEKHVKNTFLVDIPSLHIWYALGPKNILYYILREIQLQQDAKSQGQQQQQGQGTRQDERQRKRSIRQQKRLVIHEIKENIKTLGVVNKLKEIITTHIKEVNDSQLQLYLGEPSNKQSEDVNDVQDKISKESSLGVLLILLLRSSAAAAAVAADEMEKKAMPTLAECYDDIINNTAEKLKEHMDQISEEAYSQKKKKKISEEAGTTHKILHDVTQYADILRGVFPASTSKRQQAQDHDTKQATTEATPGKNQIREIVDKVKQEILSEVFEDQVNKMVNEAKLEILQQLKEYRPDKKQATDVPASQDPTVEALAEETKGGKVATISNLKKQDTEKTELLDANIEEIKKKMEDVQRKIERQLHINGIVNKIQSYLNEAETLIILKVDECYVDQWEQTRNALNLLPSVAVVMILTKTESIQQRAKEQYCYPSREPIDCSLAALYHEIVLAITSQHNYDSHIFRTILDKCESDQLCMKIFARALYAKPKRSKEDLHKLQKALEALLTKSYHSIAMNMFKFSYGDMPKDYQSCLLYLAIFPRGHKIRRSTLIGRWVAEGMITTEDWRWSSSVDKAEQCFDALVTRGLVYSAETEISATGKVKSCMVGDLVHEFITKIAKKQRIVEARLSHHLARHFSIFNDLHLRGSENIVHFLKRLSESSQWSRIKVLDLEGCKCFMENRHYLKNICNNILLLKYLSLRGTDVNWLPREINNLRELEVLDIQRTEVPEFYTRDLLLLKLKRLLAGNKKPSPNSTNHVLVPGKIEKMLDMEVLSNVKAKISQDLIDIGKLWQLRKLGVVIEDKVSHLNNLLQAISDLHECLQSLSITLGTTKHKIIHPRILKCSPKVYDNKATVPLIKRSPKVLERLSINGNILHNQLLPFLADASTPLIKVTLSNISLSQDNLVALAKLHMLHCLKFRHNTYTDNKLAFKEVEFKKLKYFLVEGSNWIEISFEEDTVAPELEKIVLSFDNIESIAGVGYLKKLEELELNNKSSNNIGGNTDTAATNQDPSTLAATSAANPSPFPANNTTVIPSTLIGTNPTPSPPAGGAADPSPHTADVDAANPSLLPPNTTTVVSSTPTGTHLFPSPPTGGATNPSPHNVIADTTNPLPLPLDTTTIAPSTPTGTNSLAPSPTTGGDANPSPHTVTTDAANPSPLPLNTTTVAPSTPTGTNSLAPSPTTGGATNPSPLPLNTTAVIPSNPAGSHPAPSPPIGGAANPSPLPPNTTTAVPSTPTGTHPIPSPPTGGAANPSPHIATADTTNPSLSAPTTSTNNVLLPKLLSDAKQISKVTLHGTMLAEDGIRTLARMENIRCLVLLHGSYNQSRLDVNKDEFIKLNLLIVSCPKITEIIFERGSAPKLEKIVWTFDHRTSLSGIEHLPRLKELEFTGDSLPNQVKEDIDKCKDIIQCTHYKPERQDQTVRSTGKEDSVSSCPHIWKDKSWRRRN